MEKGIEALQYYHGQVWRLMGEWKELSSGMTDQDATETILDEARKLTYDKFGMQDRMDNIDAKAIVNAKSIYASFKLEGLFSQFNATQKEATLRALAQAFKVGAGIDSAVDNLNVVIQE